MAMMYQDDGPIAYSYALKEPTKYQLDEILHLAPFFYWATIINWGNDLLSKLLHIDIFYVVWFNTAFTFFLLGLGAIFCYNKCCKDWITTSTATLLLILIWPPQWNLAQYNVREFLFTPYPGDAVLPFVLTVFGCLVGGRYLLCLIVLFFAGFVHITIPLQTSIIVAVYFFIEILKRETPPLIAARNLLILGVIVLFQILRTYYLGRTTSNPTSDTDLLFALNHNVHIIPWATSTWRQTITNVALVVMFAFAAYFFTRALIPYRYKILFWILAAVSFVSIWVHLIAVNYQIITLMQVNLFRITLLFSLMAIPVLGALILKRYIPHSINLLVIAALSIGLLKFAHTTGTNFAYPEAIAMKDVQLWAKDNLDSASMVATMETSWRTLSNRPAYFMWPMMLYRYYRDPFLKRREDDLLKFYQIGLDSALKLSLNELQTMVKKRFEKLTNQDFLSLKQYAPVTYLLIQKPTHLTLPKAYENARFILFSLK